MRELGGFSDAPRRHEVPRSAPESPPARFDVWIPVSISAPAERAGETKPDPPFGFEDPAGHESKDSADPLAVQEADEHAEGEDPAGTRPEAEAVTSVDVRRDSSVPATAEDATTAGDPRDTCSQGDPVQAEPVVGHEHARGRLTPEPVDEAETQVRATAKVEDIRAHEALGTADDEDWHRIITAEHQQEALHVQSLDVATKIPVEADAEESTDTRAQPVIGERPVTDDHVDIGVSAAYESTEDVRAKVAPATEAPAAREARDVAVETPLTRLRQTIDTPVAAIADDNDWHRIIIAEHQQEALHVLDDIERCFSGSPSDVTAYVEAVTAARRSGNLVWYPSELLKAVLVALAKEILLQLLLPGVFLPPTDLISALFTAAQLGEYAGEA